MLIHTFLFNSKLSCKIELLTFLIIISKGLVQRKILIFRES